MVLKCLKVTLSGLFLFTAVYLLIVFLWASSVAGELLSRAPFPDQVSRLQPRHVQALIKVEDPTFLQHPGLNISKGQGLTTITSVLARDLFLG